MAENTRNFIEKIVNVILKKRLDSENLIRVKPAVVIGCDEKSGKTSVYMLDDNTKKPYNLLNKTGETLSEGDTVKVYYTSNLAKGWIGMRGGELDKSTDTSVDVGLEAITAITINSNTDYSVSTNAGIERYVGIFEAP